MGAPKGTAIPKGLKKVNDQRRALAIKHRELDDLSADEHIEKAKSTIESLKNRSKVAALCHELGHDPMRSLILLAQNGNLTPGDKMRLEFKLLDKLVGDMKSVDGEMEEKMNVTVHLTSYKSAHQDDLPSTKRGPEEYTKFLEEDVKVNSGQSDGTIQFDDGS